MKLPHVICIFIGALAGAGLVWLFTSDEGKAFLADLKEKAGELKDELEKEISKAKETFERETENA